MRPSARSARKSRWPRHPRQVKAWLTADVKYRLYVNGRLVSRGPVDIGRDFAGGETHRWFYDYRDLTPYFTPGKNVIAAEVFRHWPADRRSRAGSRASSSRPRSSLPGQGKLTVKSDASWRAIPAAQFPNATTYDAGKEPAGWRMPGFDDAAWPACREVQDLWAPLVASEIPPLMEARYPVLRIEGLPNRTITADGSFRVVFDRVLSAYPTLKVKGGQGAVMTIKAHQQATMILGGGEQCFEFPFMTEIAPAFTVELKNVKTPVEIVDVGANFTSQPRGVPRRVRVQRRAVEPDLEGLALGRADLPADAPPRFAEPPGADQRSGRLRDRGDGQPLRLRPAVAHAAGRAQVRLAAEGREVSQLPHQLLDRLAANADGLLRLHGRQGARRGNGPLRPRVAGHLRLVAGQERAHLRGAQLHVHGLGRDRRLRLPSSAGGDRPGLPHGASITTGWKWPRAWRR